MEFPSYHQPYSHRTRFQLVRSTTKLVKNSKIKPTRSSSQFKLIRNTTTQPVLPSPKPTLIRSKSVDKSSTVVAKHIGNKYKWIRTSLRRTDTNSFKLDRRVTKRKPRASLSKCLVRIRGVKFQTHPNGKCLQRLSIVFENGSIDICLIVHFDSATDSDLLSSPTPIEQATKSRANLLLQRSIQISNGRYRLRNAKKKSKRKNCIYFNRFGKCHRGDKCPFIHDRTRIAVCTQFLNGRCQNSSCPYSHDLTPGKVPTCSYFIKGACGQDNCPYAHSYVGHDAQVCDDFLQGFCSKGIECSKQHVLTCPQFETTGQCSRGKQCHLTHRRKRHETKIWKTSTTLPKTEDQPPLLPSIMPAYIPLNQETVEKKSPAMELKLKPSFLS